MEYKLLSKIFYSNQKTYDAEYESRLNSPSTIRFSFKIKNNTAFIMITPEIFNKLYEIEELDKALTSLTDVLPGIALDQYVKRCLIQEIVLTNEIEGVISTRQDVFEALEAQKYNDKNKRLYGLVKRYQKLKDNEDLSIKTCQDIRNIYNDLALQEVIADNPQNMPDGIYFRKHGVNVTSQFNKVIHTGVSPEDELNSAMTVALDILNNSNVNILLRVAIFHYLFGYIHPFYDGNGRTSRFISSYLLSKNLNVLTGYRLAYTIKENITAYHNSFKLVNDEKNKGDLTPFVTIFFDILIKSFNILIDSISKRYDQLEYYSQLSHELLDNDDKLASVAFVIFQNTIFGTVGISFDELVHASLSTEYTVKKAINILKNKNLLKITKSGNKYLYDFDMEKLR